MSTISSQRSRFSSFAFSMSVITCHPILSFLHVPPSILLSLFLFFTASLSKVVSSSTLISFCAIFSLKVSFSSPSNYPSTCAWAILFLILFFFPKSSFSFFLWHFPACCCLPMFGSLWWAKTNSAEKINPDPQPVYSTEAQELNCILYNLACGGVGKYF